MIEQVCVAVSSRLMLLLLRPPNARARENTQLTAAVAAAAARHARTMVAPAKILLSIIIV